jgi:hypothetical protein
MILALYILCGFFAAAGLAAIFFCIWLFFQDPIAQAAAEMNERIRQANKNMVARLHAAGAQKKSFDDHVHVPLKNHVGHATFSSPPTPALVEAVNKMADLAYYYLKAKENR